MNGQCFKDNEQRILDGGHFESSNMTIENCLRYCSDGGFNYAGVQYSKQCFCGNTTPVEVASNCDRKCSGNKNQVCGGSWALNVYSISKG